MLALVHPVQHNPSTDSPHHTTSRLPRPPRKPHSVSSSSVVASSSTSFSRLASAQPPQPTRHLPAPALSTTTTPLALKHTQSQPLPNGLQSPLRPASPVTKHPPAPTTPAPAAFDIHAYPAQELLKLLASLLTQIAATNDQLSPTSPTQPNAPSQSPLPSMDHEPPIWHTLTTASRTALATPSSTLTFHARNIPTISLEAYLLRILKYCPTTNEVFLSLLVYFDRMSKLSNEATGKMFIIDSYNIHRLVIAGVTVASKFFSDVFYTNSRYAKVTTSFTSFCSSPCS
jgi:PHO85 cyclin-6/7